METKEKQRSILKIVVGGIFLAITLAAFVFSSYIFGEESIFNQAVVENSFLQTLYGKIPAIIQSIQIVTIAAFLSMLLSFIMTKAFAKSNRGITVVKLLNSFLKWIIIIAVALMVLGAFGVDTATLIASAGILSLVIGLGAQSLVADIIAGLFIVIEGEYQVGDIVIIDDWRGTVREIGIRTTKMEDAGGNIKIVNNSEIKTIINQTQALSVAKATMSIEYGESIPRVEIVLRDNLDAIKAAIPEIIEGPFYKGVNALSASSVDLLLVAKCKEEDLYTVQRAMNRELKMLFDKHNVNIPFAQIVVNQPAGDKGTLVTKGMESSAQAFAEEQRTVSKYIEEKVD